MRSAGIECLLKQKNVADAQPDSTDCRYVAIWSRRTYAKDVPVPPVPTADVFVFLSMSMADIWPALASAT